MCGLHSSRDVHGKLLTWQFDHLLIFPGLSSFFARLLINILARILSIKFDTIRSHLIALNDKTQSVRGFVASLVSLVLLFALSAFFRTLDLPVSAFHRPEAACFGAASATDADATIRRRWAWPLEPPTGRFHAKIFRDLQTTARNLLRCCDVSGKSRIILFLKLN